jgi:hypothetical protein
MNYEIGMKLAYLVVNRHPTPNFWVITELVKMTKTQGTLSNGLKFRLDTGKILGYSNEVKNPADPVIAAQIAETTREKEAYEHRLEQVRRVNNGIDNIQRGYYGKLNGDQLQIIADAIEQALAMNQ